MLLDSWRWIRRTHVSHRLLLHFGQILRLREVLQLVRQTLVCRLQIGIREVHVELWLLIRHLPVLSLRRQFIRLFRLNFWPRSAVRCASKLDYVDDADVVAGGVNRHLASLMLLIVVASAQCLCRRKAHSAFFDVELAWLLRRVDRWQNDSSW